MMGRREPLDRQCKTIEAIAGAVAMAGIEPEIRDYLMELIGRARIVAARPAPGKFRRLSMASTRQLYLDVQFLLEPPILSRSLLTQIAQADLALSVLSAQPRHGAPG